MKKTIERKLVFAHMRVDMEQYAFQRSDFPQRVSGYEHEITDSARRSCALSAAGGTANHENDRIPPHSRNFSFQLGNHR